MGKSVAMLAIIAGICLYNGGADCKSAPSLSVQDRTVPDLSGSWSGKIPAGPAELTIVFSFEKTDSGEFICTMESPDQGKAQFDARIDMLDTDSLSISVPEIGATYNARLVMASQGGRPASAEGIFTQLGAAFPLELTFGRPIIFRPQTPVPPYPYKTEEVCFRNGDVTLSGTLTWPSGYNDKDKVPAVLMVTGSGHQDRNEEIFSHKPFLVIADYLARHGIATLRYDDRGTGRSTGDPLSVTMQSNLEDAIAGIHYLDSLGKFGPVGMLGHSEGGSIAFMAGAEGKTGFIISLAGAAVSGKEILVEQNRTALSQAGVPQEVADSYCTLLGKVLEYRAGNIGRIPGPDDNKAGYIVDSLAKNSGISLPAAATENLTAVLSSGDPWIDSFITFRPEDMLGKVRCPVFAANGSLDSQVNAEMNLGALKRELPDNCDTVIREYQGLNHLFQHCKTGNASEYGQIIETFSKDVLKDIAGWIAVISLP